MLYPYIFLSEYNRKEYSDMFRIARTVVRILLTRLVTQSPRQLYLRFGNVVPGFGQVCVKFTYSLVLEKSAKTLVTQHWNYLISFLTKHYFNPKFLKCIPTQESLLIALKAQ